MTGLREGRGRPGGAHGSAPALAVEIYGVVARYMASLAGFGPCAQPLPRRIGCLAFSAASLPFQFIPLRGGAARQGARTRRGGAGCGASWNRCSRSAATTDGAIEVQG